MIPVLTLIVALLLSPAAQPGDTCTADDMAALDATTRQALNSQQDRMDRLSRILDGFAPDDSIELVYWSFTAEASLLDTYAEAVYPDCLLPLLDSYTAVISDMYALAAIMLWRMDNDNALSIARMDIAFSARLAQAARHMDDWQQLYAAYERLP